MTKWTINELAFAKGTSEPVRQALLAMNEKLNAPWSSLTDDEIKEIIGPWGDTPIKGYTREMFDKIDEALRRKNHDAN
jgi:hypothetical protein